MLKSTVLPIGQKFGKEKESHFLFNIKKNTFSDCGPLDLAIMLDSSGSVGANGWRAMLNFVKDLVREIPIGPSDNLLAVVSFGNEATLHFNLPHYMNRNDMLNALDVIPWKNQWTNTSGAITMVRRNVFEAPSGERQGIPNIGKMAYLLCEIKNQNFCIFP